LPEKLTFASDEQKRFFFERPGGVLGFYGGFGSGKSTALVLKLLYIADKFPGAQIALIRRTSVQLRKTTMSTLLTWLPSDRIARFNEQMGIIELKNGSKFFLMHLEGEESLGVLKSLELTAAGVDQAEEIDVKALDWLEKRVGRWRGVKYDFPEDWKWRDQMGQPVAPPWLLLSFNSPGYDHWLWTRFADESPERKKWAERGYRLIVASSRDNKFLGKSNLESLLAGGKEFVERYVDAISWGVSEGLVFNLSQMSILDPEEGIIDKIKRGMKLHRSLDHGETAPSCCLWSATDHDNNIFVYREYYEANPLVSYHRQQIHLLSKADNTRYTSNVADPSIFAKARGRDVASGPRWSIADEYQDSRLAEKETAIPWLGADNGEEVTRARMREYLRIDPNHRHPITGVRGAPHLYFIKKTAAYPFGCDHVISEIRAQKYVCIGEANDGKQMFSETRDEHVVDHAYDACKYFVVGRPPLGAAPSRPEAGPGEVYLSDYFAAQERIHRGKRREARLAGVGVAGYGV
jgi:phage terminase large subunit